MFEQGIVVMFSLLVLVFLIVPIVWLVKDLLAEFGYGAETKQVREDKERERRQLKVERMIQEYNRAGLRYDFVEEEKPKRYYTIGDDGELVEED